MSKPQEEIGTEPEAPETSVVAEPLSFPLKASDTEHLSFEEKQELAERVAGPVLSFGEPREPRRGIRLQTKKFDDEQAQGKYEQACIARGKKQP